MSTPSHPRALVVGGSGFLGAHAVAAFVRHAAEVAEGAASDTGVVGACRRPADAPLFSSPRDAAEWREVDLAVDGAARALLEEVRPGRVLNCAALSRVGDCEKDPSAAARLNAEVPAEIAEWCAGEGVRLVHVSTDLVFGRDDAPPSGFDEGAAPAPLSVYGESKVAGEREVLARCPAALVARLPLLYGNSGGRGLGASDSLLEAVEREAGPGLFVDEWRTPLEVTNAAEALAELAAGTASGLLHVAGPDRVTRHALGLAILRAMGLPDEEAAALVRAVRRDDVPTTGARPRDVSLAVTRARELLAARGGGGGVRLDGIDEGLQRAVR